MVPLPRATRDPQLTRLERQLRDVQRRYQRQYEREHRDDGRVLVARTIVPSPDARRSDSISRSIKPFSSLTPQRNLSGFCHHRMQSKSSSTPDVAIKAVAVTGIGIHPHHYRYVLV
jgi:hypothetical protein